MASGQLTHLDILDAQVASSDHIKDSTGGTADDLLTRLELSNVLSDTGSTDTSVTRDVHVVAQGEHNRLNLDGQLSRR